MAQNTVNIERWRYIGGSDIPIILGISEFKTRYQLLQEKAQIIEDTFEGNKYTEFGNILEPQIRAYINANYDSYFVEGKHYAGDVRIHTDGEDDITQTVLEVKTTSRIYDDVNKYKVYLAQLLFYMDTLGWENGLLAVYERPATIDKFSLRFDALRLSTYEININNYTDFVEQIRREVDLFREDVKKIRENPFLLEKDFFPESIQDLANKLVEYEKRNIELENTFYKSKKELENKLVDVLKAEGLKKCTGFDGWSFSITPKENIKSSHKGDKT